MVGKQTATLKHPFPFYMTSSHNFQKAEHYTLESSCRLYDQSMANGAKLKIEKKVNKCCSSPFIKTKIKKY